MGVVALEAIGVDLFSYIEVDITPVVAMLSGRGRRLVAGLIRTLVGVSVPLIALGDRPVGGWAKRGNSY